MTDTMTQRSARRFGRRAAVQPDARRPFAVAQHGDHSRPHDHAYRDRPSGAQARGRHGGRGGGHSGRRGRGGAPRVGKGDVRAATLLLLAEQPLHGYQIIHLIEEQSQGFWRPSAGSVYPALQLLEDEGLVQPEPLEGRRVYHLTEAGRAYVEERRDELTAARDAVTAPVGEGWVELHDLLHQVGTALRQVAQVGTPSQRAAAAALLVSTRRQLYRILADDADDAAPPAPREATTRGEEVKPDV